MNVSDLPTDNLYKFAALGGLALMVAGFLLGQRAEEATEQIPTVLAQKLTTFDPAAIAHSDLLFDDLNKRIHSAISQRAAAVEESERAEIDRAIQDLFNRAFETGLNKVRSGHTLKLLDLDLRSLENRLDSATYNVALAHMLIWFGCATWLLSFAAWYYLHQRHQDALARLAPRKLKLELRTLEQTAVDRPQQ